MDYIDKKVKKICIELKENGTEKEVLREVKKRRLKRRVIMLSFREEILKKIRKIDKRAETGLIYKKHFDPIKSALKLKAKYLVPFYLSVRIKDVKRYYKSGLKVIVWTINNKRESLKYARMRVEA